jgi:hypothetical protein
MRVHKGLYTLRLCGCCREQRKAVRRDFKRAAAAAAAASFLLICLTLTASALAHDREIPISSLRSQQGLDAVKIHACEI